MTDTTQLVAVIVSLSGALSWFFREYLKDIKAAHMRELEAKDRTIATDQTIEDALRAELKATYQDAAANAARTLAATEEVAKTYAEERRELLALLRTQRAPETGAAS